MTRQISYTAQITKYLSQLGKRNGHVNPDAKSNSGQLLGEAFMWDTAQKECAKRAKLAWKALTDNDLVEPKAALREKFDGQQIVAESPMFSCVAKVNKGRSTFDLQEFIQRVAKKHKLSAAALTALAEDCKHEGTKSVSVGIVEKAQ